MKIYIDFEVNKIQEIRLIHAISEQGVEVSVPEEQAYKFKPLQDKFNMNYSVDSASGIPLSQFMYIDHKIPNTTIGNSVCPLIFPKIQVQYLRNNWSVKRPYKFSFSGLITPVRHVVIQNWLTEQLKSKKQLNYNSKQLLSRIKNKFNRLFSKKTQVHKYNDLYISSSTNGRHFPEKSWDQEYYNFLLKSKFVLCPSGDYVWSYRFFESILCGAIPVIEEFCSVYEGYKYVTLKENAHTLEYNLEDALFNYKLCVSRITLRESFDL